MTKSSLAPGQRELVEVIEALDFGVIEQLLFRGGLPCIEPKPRIVQTIKLDARQEGNSHHSSADLTLKRAFDNLFETLAQLQDGVVDIEVRHGAPFGLVLARSFEGLLA